MIILDISYEHIEMKKNIKFQKIGHLSFNIGSVQISYHSSIRGRGGVGSVSDN